MTYKFVPMNQEYASTIVKTWKYQKDYSIYDYVNEADHMLDQEGWGRGIFAVLNEESDLVGELSIEFLDSQGHFTDYRDFDDLELTGQRELWIGFGLRPDLVGRGLGFEFVSTCVDYALQKFQYHGEFIRLGVALFNQRAIKTYERAGFQSFEFATGDIAGQEFNCTYMRKSI
ncbi:MAG: N-acetyltransferase [Chloroflexi bacterium HGW-Chloroflexi-4]|jgi:ribosomal-protein-alanine N-acetyltransferase|nr:MAG: N-acetyltransferase [Chloroflexi bacterium HGW-Chloroflexi-4]